MVFIIGLLLSLVVSTSAQAALWTGILDATRGADWQSVPFTKPNLDSWTQCGATISAPSSSAVVNAAIAACGTNQYVQLAAGTFTLTTGITFAGKSHVALRGMGPNQTFLAAGKVSGCLFGTPNTPNICVAGSTSVYTNGSGASGPIVVNWTTGYSQGATSITVNDATGIEVGQYVFLDQINEVFDPLTNYLPFISCVDPYVPGGGCVTGRGSTRQTTQVVRVTAKAGTTLTITPGLYFHRWSGSQSPQLWRVGTKAQTITNVGIEDLSIDTTAPGTGSFGGVMFINASESWVRNIRVNQCDTQCVGAEQSAKIMVLDSYFYKSTSGGASTSYGINCGNSSDVVIQNNIFQQISTPLQAGNCHGLIFAYNYGIYAPWAASPDFMIGMIFPAHEAGSMYGLMEGNVMNEINLDVAHGTNAYITGFRNRLNGWQFDRTNSTIAIASLAFNRFPSWIGNVLGTDGYHTNYESSQGPQGVTGNFSRTVYVIGWSSGAEGTGSPGYDPITLSSTLRWGNCDYATDTCRWNSSEIPSDNAVPSTQTLPPSFYLTAKPSWFGDVAWPPIGPDVTGGVDPLGWARRIPSEVCYLTSMGGPSTGLGSVLTFNANNCYAGGGTDTTPPAAPTGVTISTTGENG